MAHEIQYESGTGPEQGKPKACLVCEAMLPDAVDGLLSESEQRAFDKHVAGCMACAEELAEAQRGAAWLHMLKGHAPEPSALLLNKILAQTTGAEAAVASPPMRDEAARERGTQSVAEAQSVAGPLIRDEAAHEWGTRSRGNLLQFRRRLADIFTIQNSYATFQPRLAMTAAMAFFSVALTLNMTGVKLSSMRASNFSPSSLRRTVADTSASAVRSFQNMRVVYQFESRLEDLRQDDTDNERMHTASPYATPSASEPRQDDKSSGKQDDSQQAPKGHSTLELPALREDATLRKGV